MARSIGVRLLCMSVVLFSLNLLAACKTEPRPEAERGSATTAPAAPKATAHNFDRWEREIAAFERRDRESPPPKGGILFIGSSTIRLWKSLATDFPEHKTINRGFGGSEIVDSTHFAERVIFPYEPKTIFLRAGGNDIHNGKSPEQVFGDFKEFVETVHERLPRTEVVFISLCPTIARWKEADDGTKLNKMIDEYAQRMPRVSYIETGDMSLGGDGKPRPELFVADGLHFNDAGYRILAEKVRPHMPK